LATRCEMPVKLAPVSMRALTGIGLGIGCFFSVRKVLSILGNPIFIGIIGPFEIKAGFLVRNEGIRSPL